MLGLKLNHVSKRGPLVFPRSYHSEISCLETEISLLTSSMKPLKDVAYQISSTTKPRYCKVMKHIIRARRPAFAYCRLIITHENIPYDACIKLQLQVSVFHFCSKSISLLVGYECSSDFLLLFMFLYIPKFCALFFFSIDFTLNYPFHTR